MSYAIKFRHIFPTYLLIALGSAIVLLGGRWLLDEQLGIEIPVEVWEIWLPLCFPWLPMIIWLDPRVDILEFGNVKVNMYMQVIAGVTISGPLILGEIYLSTAMGDIQHVSDLTGLHSAPVSQYYTLDEFEVDTSRMIMGFVSTTSGKYDQYLNMNVYVAVPMMERNATMPFPYYYALTFRKQISSGISDEEKENERRMFQEFARGKVKAYPYHEFTYLERLGPSDDLSAFRELFKGAEQDEKAFGFFVPRNDPFESRSGGLHGWAFRAFILGTLIFLLALLWPNVKREEYERLRSVGRKEEDDSLNTPPREP